MGVQVFFKYFADWGLGNPDPDNINHTSHLINPFILTSITNLK